MRDLRVRWALEEAGLPYRGESVRFGNRSSEHFADQPFGQVPWLTDGDISIFESGAILLHLDKRQNGPAWLCIASREGISRTARVPAPLLAVGFDL